jgi:hypothetical protein
MPYIGNTPALDYISFAVQNFTVTAGTTVYTLDYSVSNENDIALYINSVAQRPGASFAYSATGTTLTLTSATLATDTMYAVFIGRAVQTVTPPASSVTNTMLSPSVITGQTAETSIAGGDSVLIYDDSASALRKMTRTNFIGGGNAPIFHAYRSTPTAQVIPNNAYTVGELQAEFYDTDSAFDTSTYRFTVPTGKGGIYFFFFGLAFTSSVPDAKTLNVGLMKNGGIRYMSLQGATTGVAVTNAVLTGSYTEQLSDGDYIQLIVYQNSGTTQNLTGGSPTGNVGPFLAGFRVIQ